MMELDDIRKNWKAHHQELNEHLDLNINSLQKEILQKSKNELFMPLLHEMLNIVIVSLTVIVVTVFCFMHWQEFRFSIPGLLGAGIGLAYVYYALVKATKIAKLDYYRSSIVEIQKNISTLNLLILRYRKLEITLFPFFIGLIMPIVFKVIQKRDLYADIRFFLLEALFVIGLGLVGVYYTNKYLYDKRIKKVQFFLKEIREFEG